MNEQYKRLLREILDTLEGGDVALDFEDMPSAATTLRIIANIAGTALRGVEAIEELHKMLNKEYGDEDKHKELSK
tara:strand:- start:3012 stop:3236 length:225 start_codon:yes stop_codon:yes gene_type:complete